MDNIDPIQSKSDIKLDIQDDLLISQKMHEFRIKKLGIAILAALAAATVATSTLGVFGIVSLALAKASVIAFISALVLGILCKIDQHSPEPLKATSQLVQSVVFEILSMLTLAILFPLDLERFDPQEKNHIAKDQVPVLLIHGIFGSSNNWVYHKRRLQEKGYKNIFTINLGHPFRSNTKFGEKIRAKVQEIHKLTSCPYLFIVAHSMGGNDALEFLYNHPVNEVKVPFIITLGSPLSGTVIAYVASWISYAARELLPNSAFITSLQAKLNADTETKYHLIGSKVDLIIIPRKSAIEKGLCAHAETTLLEKTPHAGLLFSDTAADIVVNDILKANEQVRLAFSQAPEASCAHQG